MLLLAAAMLPMAMLPMAASTQESSLKPPPNLNIKALGGLSYDGATGRMVLFDVQVSQEDYEVRADRWESSSLELEDATWYFAGNVRFGAYSAQMTSDSAELTFLGGRLQSAIISGNPVTMRNEGDKVVEGSAPTVEYDAETGLVRFLGGAALETAESRMSGESINFDLRKETVVVTPRDGEPVQILFEFFTSGDDEEP